MPHHFQVSAVVALEMFAARGFGASQETAQVGTPERANGIGLAANRSTSSPGPSQQASEMRQLMGGANRTQTSQMGQQAGKMVQMGAPSLQLGQQMGQMSSMMGQVLQTDPKDEISRQFAEWDSAMDSIDRNQEQLLNDQWRLLRTQIGALMGALAEMRGELTELKGNLVSKEVEGVIEKMITAHDEHGKNHDSIFTRLKYLEDFIGESSEKHGSHATTMETRLEYLEGLIGDSSDKHSNELDAAKKQLTDLSAAISACAKQEHSASMEERVDYLEKFLGESAEKHAKEIKDTKNAHVDHQTSVETRLEYLESLLGDSADKHAKELAAAQTKLADLSKAIVSCSKAEHHNSLEERVDYLEKFLGESADKHEKELADHKKGADVHKTTMEARLEYVEALLGDSSDKHAQEIADAKNKLGDLHAALKSCAKSDHHASLEQRMEYIENFIGESADKHERELKDHKKGADAHKTTMETRLEYLESLLGDNADKHAQEIADAKSKLGDLHAALKSCARSDHHVGLEKRMDYLEKFLGESADKQEQELKEHKKGAEGHKTNMETRLEFLERMIGDSADKHAKELAEAKNKLGDLHAAVKSCAKTDHHASLEQRMDYLEQFLGESADKHQKDLAENKKGTDAHKESMETRLEYVEALLGDNADKHSKDLDAAKAKLGDLHAAVKACAKADHHDDLEKRMDDMEKRITVLDDHDLFGKHAKDIQGHKDKLSELEALLKTCGKAEHGSALEKRVAFIEKFIGESATSHDDHKATMETRLEYIESLVGDSADKHAKEIKAAKDKLKDLHAAVASCAKSDHHADLESRFEQLEASVVAGAGKADKAVKDVDLANAKIRELQAKIMGDYSIRDQNSGAMEERLDNYDRSHGIHNENASKNYRDIELLQGKLRDTMSKVDQCKALQESHKATADQRFSYIETIMMEQAGVKVIELTKDTEQRFLYMQDEQKRARDVLESSLVEQLRLEQSARDAQAAQIKEQWEREMKARQAYQDNYKELLAHERMAREANEINFDRRCYECEHALSQEAQRLWQAIERQEHHVVIEKHALPPPRPAPVEVRVAPTEILPTLHQRVVAPPRHTQVSTQVVRGMSPAPTGVQVVRAVPTVPLGTQSVGYPVGTGSMLSTGSASALVTERVLGETTLQGEYLGGGSLGALSPPYGGEVYEISARSATIGQQTSVITP